MINLNISSTGEITISQETPEERVYMGDHYAQEAQEETETDRDDERASFFKKGWEAAVRETQLAFVNGHIVQFFNDMGVQDGGEDPHHAEPEGTGEKIDQPLIRPAVDSGEPEKEIGDAFSDADLGITRGTWTISDEELQSLKDAEFERGVAYESPTVNRRITDAELAVLEAMNTPRQVQFSSLRAIADRLAGEEHDGQRRSTVDDLLKRIAESLGFEVVL